MNFWKNLHPLLRRAKGVDNRTANAAILQAIANSLTDSEQKIIVDKIRESLATAPAEYLDYWGTWFGLIRKKDETDDHYRNRIKHYLLLGRSTKQSIINAIRHYLQDTDSHIDVYEPWKNVFRIDNSKLDGADHMQGEYYRYGVIDVSLGVPLDENIMRVINAFKPVGVKVYTNYNPLLNKDNKVTYLGKQDSEIISHIYLELGCTDDTSSILLGLDDYNNRQVVISKLKPFNIDNSKLDSADVLTSPYSENYNPDNMLLGTSVYEQTRKNPFSQDTVAKEGVKYSFRGFINPDIRAMLSLNFLNSAGVPIKKINSKEIKHNEGTLSQGFTQVELSGVAPVKTTGVQLTIDNRSNRTDNIVKKSQAKFHNDGKESFPVSFDLAKDLSGVNIATRIEFTVSNLKNEGFLSIVDGQDTDNWKNLVPVSITEKPPETTDKEGFILDNSKLDSDKALIKANIGDKPVPPITENGTYTYELVTEKHALKKGAVGNRVFVRTNLDADIDLKIKVSVYSVDMDMNYSVYLDEDGYYNDYKIKEFKLASGNRPNLNWTPAPTEVKKPSPYYVDIINNTNVTYAEQELRNTKFFNSTGAKLSFAKLHNRNIALKTGFPVVKQSFDSIEHLYDLSIPVVSGKTYTVLMNYASNDVNKDKEIVITLGNTEDIILETPLNTNGDIKTYHGTYKASVNTTDKYLKLSVKNGTASDLYILNFKLGVD